MESERRSSRPVRKPLSDCTNRIANSSSQSSSSSSLLLRKPGNPTLSSAFAKLLSDLDSSKSAKPAPRNDAVTTPCVSVIPPAVSSTPSLPPRSSSASGRGDCEVLEPCSVYTRRKTAEKSKNKVRPTEERLSIALTEKRKSKGKAIDEPLSCPPATKIRKIGEKIKEDGSRSLSKAGAVPCKKKQPVLPSRKYSAKNALSQDYIEQQRAYFAEIDAFELPEEEVESISDLD